MPRQTATKPATTRRRDGIGNRSVPPGPGLLLGRTRASTPRPAFGFTAANDEPAAAPKPQLLRDASDNHVAVFAPTGAGKSRNLLVPTLLSSTDSAIVLDVKGELARITARYRREQLGQAVHIIDPWGCVTRDGASLNPLATLHPDDPGLADEAYALAGLLIDQTGKMDEIYWDESAQSVVAGLITHVVTATGEQRRNFGRVWDLAHSGDTVYDLAVLLDTTPNMHPYAKAQIAGLLALSADVTRSCILSVLRQHLRVFASDLVRQAVDHDSIGLSALAQGKPTTIYIVVPPDKLRSHKALIRLWLSTILTVLMRRTRLPDAATLLLLDEVAQFGPLPQITQAVTLMRGYGLRCVLMLQSLAQLKHGYGAEQDVLLDNCGTIVTFGHSNLGMSRQLAAMLGDIDAEQLFAMTDADIAIRTGRNITRVSERIDYLNEPALKARADKNRMHEPRGRSERR